MTEGVHGGLALSSLPEVVSANDRVVLGTYDGHPVGGGANEGVPGLGHVPARLRIGTLLPGAALGRMDPDVGHQLVEVGEPAETIQGFSDAETRKSGVVIEFDGTAIDKIMVVLAEAKVV